MQRSYKNSIDEYIERVTRLQKTPSPKRGGDDDHKTIVIVDHATNQQPQAHERARDMREKACTAELREKSIQIERDEKRRVHDEKTIDLEADGYILQKHKNFESSKFDTFKAY